MRNARDWACRHRVNQGTQAGPKSGHPWASQLQTTGNSLSAQAAWIGSSLPRERKWPVWLGQGGALQLCVLKATDSKGCFCCQPISKVPHQYSLSMWRPKGVHLSSPSMQGQGALQETSGPYNLTPSYLIRAGTREN